MSKNDPIRILCVEDEAFDRELIRHALEKESEGFVMTEANDRETFESFLTKGDFDVVLTDFNILGFEGLEVIRLVRERCPEVPVIVVTGTGSEEVAVQSLREGAEDYVIKTPRHIAQLPMTVRRVFEAKKTRAELLERNANFRALVANTADGILVVDSEGRILFSNPAAEGLLGSTSEGLLGQVFGHPIGNRESLEIDLPWKSGGTGRAAMRVAQTVWNKEACYIVSLRDITERKQAEEALRESEAFLNTLIDAIPIPVFYKDIEGRYL
ncbi:MAG: response regulator, partial [Deltaproteobacteria bacterium]|nr:response regulator [Deltaproteobacteria bacterium]